MYLSLTDRSFAAHLEDGHHAAVAVVVVVVVVVVVSRQGALLLEEGGVDAIGHGWCLRWVMDEVRC